MSSRMLAGLRMAVSMFTVVPVPRRWHDDDVTAVTDSGTARAALAWLPFVGGVLGALSGLVAAAVLSRSAGSALLAAVLAVFALALLTRGLHLDGLADTADGLGSRAPAERALEIMRRSDIGPFGVVTVVGVLLVDVSAIAVLGSASVWRVAAALGIAAAAGRIAVVHATLPRIPAARPGGFGALVAGRGSPALAATLVLLLLVASGLLARAVGAGIAGWIVAPAAALALAALACRHAVARLSGVTGDVFGALIELTTAATLVGLALA